MRLAKLIRMRPLLALMAKVWLPLRMRSTMKKTMMTTTMMMTVTMRTLTLSSCFFSKHGLPLLALVDKGGVLGFDLSCNKLDVVVGRLNNFLVWIIYVSWWYYVMDIFIFVV
jgi:hypothetical protein